MEQTIPCPPTPTMPDLDPMTAVPDSRPEPVPRAPSSSRARQKRTSPASANGRHPPPRRSELKQIGRRFEVALSHPFHSPDRDPGQVEKLRQRGRKLLEKQARYVAERRRGPRDKEPDGFSLVRLRDRLAGEVRRLLGRQETTPGDPTPTR